jgi:hypothetical protein
MVKRGESGEVSQLKGYPIKAFFLGYAKVSFGERSKRRK